MRSSADKTQAKPQNTPPWRSAGRFADDDTDPLSGFANIMDVMLVFALGLMLALISQSQELQQHFKLIPEQQLSQGEELTEAPQSMQSMLEGKSNGMEPLGQVYRDPQTGKLILLQGN